MKKSLLFTTSLVFTPAASIPQLSLRRAHLTALQHAAKHTAQAGAWQDTAFYIVLVILIVAIIALIAKAVRGPPRPSTVEEVTLRNMEVMQQERELKVAEKAIKNEVADDAADAEAIDYEAALRTAAQTAAQIIGPKVAKGQAIKTIVEGRIQSLTRETKSFVLDELKATAGELLTTLDAPEAMLLLDPAKATEGNFPSAPAILAGFFSPVVLALTAVNHILQALLHFLPIVCLCIASLIIDQGQPCGIPTMWEWLYAHVVVGAILFLCHLCQVVKVIVSQKALTEEVRATSTQMQALAEKVKKGEVDQIRPMFLQTCAMVQKALLQEDSVRRSFFAKCVGFFTFIWIGLTIWTFVLVLGWTMVPGTIAFHHSAHEAAGDDFCGAWFTVLTARLCCITGVIWLMINIGTVSQWFADSAKFSPAFADAILGEAKKIDDQAGGIPVVQTLVKAFVLRGSSETLELQISTAEVERSKLDAEARALETEKAAIERQIASVDAERSQFVAAVDAMGGRKSLLDSFTIKAEDLGIGMDKFQIHDKNGNVENKSEINLQEAYALVQEYMDLDNRKDQLEKASKDVDKKLMDRLKDFEQLGPAMKKQLTLKSEELAEASKKKIKELYETIMKKMEELRNSDAFLDAQRMFAEQWEVMQEAAQRSAEQAKKMAEEAKAAALKAKEDFESSPCGQAMKNGDLAKLKEMGYESLEQAQEQIAALEKSLEEQAKAAMDQVKAMADNSELGRALAAGDMEALKKLGYENAEAAMQQVEAMVEEGKRAADRAMDTELGRALKSGNPEELKKLGFDTLEDAQKKAGEMVQEGQEAINRAREALDETDVGKALKAGNLEELKQLGYENVEAARRAAEEGLAQAQAAAQNASKLLDDSDVGKALKAGDTEKLKALGFASAEEAKKQMQKGIEAGQEAAAKVRQELEVMEKAIRENDTAKLKELGLPSSIEEAQKNLEQQKKNIEEKVKEKVQEAAEAAAACK